MFGLLTEKFKNLVSAVKGKKTLTESNITEAVQEVRLALLDADVNYTVANDFLKRIQEKALGSEVVKSVSPGETFIKLLRDELVSLMGSEEKGLELAASPAVIVLCGLQGSGKTTQVAKLAAYLQKQGKKVMAAACDLERPAAILQLKQVCEGAKIPVFALEGTKDPVEVARGALAEAKRLGKDVLIIDTAGRLHVDEPLMRELGEVVEAVQPHELLFVASSLAGQDAVKAATEFNAALPLTGSILTMLDGSSKAGAALSIFAVTQKPLKFEGVGEKIGDFRPFNPESMADRILGMGDVINLVRKAEEAFGKEKEKELEEKMRKATFSYEDYLSQMQSLKQMGPLRGLMQMLPGGFQLPDMEKSELEFKKSEAMILSMTRAERMEKAELTPARRWRIAKGSGLKIEDVNRLAKGFKQMKMMMKNMPSKKQLENIGSFKWR